jgi:hypothetical protein
MKRGFLDLLDPSNDPEFFWQVISGPPCIQIFSDVYPGQNKNITMIEMLAKWLLEESHDEVNRVYIPNGSTFFHSSR